MKNVNIRLDKVLLLGFLMMILTHSLNCRYRSEASPTIIGVSPQDLNYYKGLLSSPSATIKCKDGSKVFSKSQLNDDFCDCLDGSDEPGTSACPNGKFHCKNAGHTPLILYSSRVNDGICDCCDGSDEYDGLIKCPNTCWEAGKAAREKLKKKIATYKEGVTIRKRDIEHAKISIAKDEAELSKLKDAEKGLKTLVEQLKERKEEIEKAEEKERLQKEKEEKEKMETEEPKDQEIKAQDVEPTQTGIHDKIGPISGEETQEISESDHPVGEEIPNIEAEDVKEDSSYEAEDTTTDEKVVIDTDNKDENVAEDTESLSKEELGRLVASRWTGEKSEHKKEESDSATKDVQNPDELANEPNDDEDNNYDSEDDDHKYDDNEEHKYDDDDEHKYDDDDNEEQVEDFGGENHYDSHKPDSDEELEFSDITGPSSSSSWLKKIQETAKSIFSAVNVFKKPVNISDAAQVRKEYDDSSAKLSKMQSRISSLKQKLKQDFGPEKEFYSFYGQCFEIKQNKYVYKVCPFKQATQEEGYSTTRLGSWEKFEDSYRVMQFLNGDKCWNGPDRSLTVKLRCGLKNELSEVDEPSRCEYLALLSTPALCVDSKLKELQEKLESMNKDQPQGHDEL